MLAQAWQQFTNLVERRIVPRSLTENRMLLDDAATLWLIDVRSGDVAATDLQIRLDAAQLLTTTALLVGTDRALDAALMLSARIRSLARCRCCSRSRCPAAPVPNCSTTRDCSPTCVKLHSSDCRRRRSSPYRWSGYVRALLTIVGGAVALYIVLTQLGSVNPVRIISSASLEWALIALGFSC